MRKGYLLLVGLTSANPKTYRDWNGINGCWECELDIDNVKHILKNQGYGVNPKSWIQYYLSYKN